MEKPSKADRQLATTIFDDCLRAAGCDAATALNALALKHAVAIREEMEARMELANLRRNSIMSFGGTLAPGDELNEKHVTLRERDGTILAHVRTLTNGKERPRVILTNSGQFFMQTARSNQYFQVPGAFAILTAASSRDDVPTGDAYERPA